MMARKVPDRQKLPRNRLQPHKIVTTLLWHDFEWATWTGSNTVEVRTGPMARALRLTSHRLREHFDWLVLNGYLASAATDYGKAVLVFVPPKHGLGQGTEPVWYAPQDGGKPSRIADVPVGVVEVRHMTKDEALALFPQSASEIQEALEKTYADGVKQELEKRLDKKKTLW